MTGNVKKTITYRMAYPKVAPKKKATPKAKKPRASAKPRNKRAPS